MQQQNLEAVNQYIGDHLQLYLSGLITDREFSNVMRKFADQFDQHKDELPGLIDPNTGLRYE